MLSDNNFNLFQSGDPKWESANGMDPDQVPECSVWSGSTLFELNTWISTKQRNTFNKN